MLLYMDTSHPRAAQAQEHAGASYIGTFFVCILCVVVKNAFTSALERRYGKSK